MGLSDRMVLAGLTLLAVASSAATLLPTNGSPARNSASPLPGSAAAAAVAGGVCDEKYAASLTLVVTPGIRIPILGIGVQPSRRRLAPSTQGNTPNCEDL
jgi:hypothetical protein